MLWLIPVGVMAISTASILIRLTPADPAAIAFWRLAFATAITGGLMALRGARPAGAPLGWSALSGAFLAAHFLTWIPSLFMTTVAASTTLVNLHPIFMLALSRKLREEVTPAAAAGVLTAVAGAVLITFTPGGLEGNLLALAGAAAFAGYLAVGKRARATAGTLEYTFVAYGFAALFSLGTAAALGRPLLYGPDVYLMLALIAMVPMLLGHTVFNYLLGRYRAVTVAASTLGEPVGATALAALVLGQTPGGAARLGPVEVPTEALGVAATLAGIAVVIWDEAKGVKAGRQSRP